MSKDFRASQVETSKIIASGAIASGKPLGIAIYSGSVASNREGSTTDSAMFNNVGTDVFMFVSGTIGKGNPNVFNRSDVTLFGGDIVVSGTLYAERQVIEVDQTVPGDFFVTGNMFVEPDADSVTSVSFRDQDGNTIFNVDSSNDRVGIGTAAPSHKLHVVASDPNEAEIVVTQYRDGATDPANFRAQFARGTIASPTIAQDNDLVGNITFRPYDGTNFDHTCAEIRGVIDGTPGANDVPGELQFLTNAGSTDPTERMIIRADGKVGIGVSDPDSQLEIFSTSTQLKLSNNADDFASFSVGTNGDLSISTTDADGNDDADITLSADGKVVIQAQTGDEVVLNEESKDVDFRVESNNETHMVFVDGSNNRVSIGSSTNPPEATLEVTNATAAGAFDVPLVQLNSNDVDKIALDINAGNTTANVIDVSASALTSGKAIFVDHNDSATTAIAPRTIHVDFDKSGVAGNSVTQDFVATAIEMNDGATNNAGSTVRMTAIEIDVLSANAQGATSNTGLDISVSEAATNEGIRIRAKDGAGSDIKMMSTANNSDFATIAVGTNGETTITTVDADAASANLNFVVDGATDIQSTGNVTIDASAGTIGIGTDEQDQTINIGTGGNRSVNIGKSGGTSTVSIYSKGGTLELDATGQEVNIDSAAFDVNASGAVTIDGSSAKIDASGTTEVASDTDVLLTVGASGPYQVQINQTRNLFNVGQIDSDFVVNTDDFKGTLFVDGNDNTIILGHELFNLAASSPPDIVSAASDVSGYGNDVKIMLSGSSGTKGTSTRGVVLLAGDVVISGSLYGGSPLDVKTDIGLTGSMRFKEQSAPTTYNNEAVLYAKDVSGVTKLFYKESNGTEIPLGSGGSLDDAYDTPVGGGTKSSGVGARIIADGQPVQIEVAGSNKVGLAVTGSVIFGSGSTGANSSGMPFVPDNVNFFVSGSRGVFPFSPINKVLFGGGLYVSGGIHSEYGLAINRGTALSLNQDDPVGGCTISADFSQTMNIGSSNCEGIINEAKTAWQVAAGISGRTNIDARQDYTHMNHSRADKDFIVSGNSKYGTFLLDATDETVIIGHENFDSTPTAAEVSGYGNDVKIMLSGSAGTKGTSTRGVVLIPGDAVISGSLEIENGLSGSLTQLVDGSSYLIAGSNVTITSASNGSVTISSTGTGISELSEDTSPELGGQLVTGDHKISFATGDNTSEIDFTYNGADNFTAIASVKSIDMFIDSNGGDAGQKFRIFNNLQPASSHAGGTNTDANAIFMVREEGNVFTKGYITASMGFSGSLTQLTDGTSYLIAGSNVTITSASNGAVTIAASAGSGGTLDQSYDSGGSGAGAIITVDNQPVQIKVAGASKTALAITGSVVIGSGSNGLLPAMPGNDTNFFASGSIDSRGTAIKGTSVFGGDLVVSGTLSVNRGQAGAGSAVTVTTDGKVGIGTDNPSYKLEVGGNASFGEYLYHRNNAGGQNTFMRFENDKISFTAGNQSMLSMTENGANTQVLILSGGAQTSPNEANYADTNFFVSGSAMTRGTATKGTAVFGGDLVVSGAAYTGRVLSNENNDTFLDLSNNLEIAADGKITINAKATSEVVFNENRNNVDFRVESDDNTHMLFVDALENRLGIGTVGSSPVSTVHIKDSSPTLSIQRESNSNDSTIAFLGAAGFTGAIMHLSSSNDLVFKTHDGSSPHEILRLGGHYGSPKRQVVFLSGSGVHASSMQPSQTTDVNFFVSGSAMSRGTATRGTAVFGGDLFVSGAAYTGRVLSNEDSTSFVDLAPNTIELNANHSVSIHDVMPSEFQDTNFFVSGSIGSRGNPSDRGTSVFGGDVVVSGSLIVDNVLVSKKSVFKHHLIWAGTISGATPRFAASLNGGGAANANPDIEHFWSVAGSGSLKAMDLWVSEGSTSRVGIGLFVNSDTNPRLHCTGSFANNNIIGDGNRGHLFVDFEQTQFMSGTNSFSPGDLISITLAQIGGGAFTKVRGTLYYEMDETNLHSNQSGGTLG